MSFLDTAASVLQAPKNFLWGMIPGLHDENTGQAYSGSQVASNLFGTDSGSVWNKALGLGLDVAGDPLTWAAPLIGKGVGAAAKGLGLIGDAGGAAAAAAAPIADAAGAAADAGTSAYEAMSPLRRTFGMVKQATPLSGDQSYFAQKMLEANTMPRRAIVQGAGEIGDLIGEGAGPLHPAHLQKALEQANTGIASGQMGGAFFPISGSDYSTGIGVTTGPSSARHELVHGLINAAAETGSTEGLPLSMRVPANLYRSNNPLLQGLGMIGDETAAHALENRGAMRQLGGAANFLFNPALPGRSSYYDQIAGKSRLASALYAALPVAPASAIVGGGGYAAYPYLSNVFGGQ